VLADHPPELKENRSPMTTTLTLGQIVVDAADAAAIAGFWSRLLDRPLVDGANQYFAVVPPAADGSTPALMFLAVPEPPAGKNRLHLDLVSPDQPAEVERAVGLGATRIGDFDEYGTRWTTLADPEGNVFDIGLPHA
jgi:Glyoxalase-like domain